MKLLAAFVLAAAAVSARVNFLHVADAVPNEWVVVLKPDQVSAAAQTQIATRLSGKPVSVGTKFSAVFVKDVDRAAVEAAISDVESMVSYVEPNGRVTMTQGSCDRQGGENEPVSWGQVRTSSGADPEEDNEGNFVFDGAWGEGTVSYIVDTGIRITHEDFGGRARWGINTVDNSDTDGNGHGTHVASTVGGKVWGIAKKTELVAVKVLDANGGGTFQSVMEGIEWAAKDGEGKKATINMSLGGGRSTALNEAADAAADAGVVVVVAGGNSNADSCNYSPASADKVITVGSTDMGNMGGNQVDIRSFFSNYGSCTDIFAPGSDITAAWITSDTATRTISGTSMASPHVCGVANALLSKGTSASDMLETLVSSAHSDVINLDCSNTACNNSPNKLLNLSC